LRSTIAKSTRRKMLGAIDVDRYIEQIESSQLRDLMRELRLVVRKALPLAVESIKMGIPTYSRERGKKLCIKMRTIAITSICVSSQEPSCRQICLRELERE
jgi:glycerol-3-phosphate dehydrogenase